MFVFAAESNCLHAGAQDVSRLADICRQSIVFESVGGIVACLALIAQDKDVEIIRIKNKLDPAYDSAQSAGYRDLAMNICITTPEAQALGTSAHVCELQLVLRQYAEVKVRARPAFQISALAMAFNFYFGAHMSKSYSLLSL